MRVLVTGITGMLGNNVARLLLEEGATVRALVRANSDARPLAGLEVETVQGDVRDAACLRSASQDVQWVIHCAGRVHIGWSGLDESQQVNVEGTRNVAQAAMAVGARMVHVSTMSTLAIGQEHAPADEDAPRVGQVPCPYVVTKRAAEELVLEQVECGLDAVIVNPGLILGPWDWKPSSGRMMLQIARRFIPLAPAGGVSVCDARDVAAGMLAAARSGRAGRCYLLTGHNVRYFDLWHKMAQITGGGAPWWPMRLPARVIAGFAGDLLFRVTGREPDVNSASIRVSRQFHYYCCARAEQELGYRCRPLQETLEDAWEWFQQHSYA